jgi:hypothetical protein
MEIGMAHKILPYVISKKVNKMNAVTRIIFLLEFVSVTHLYVEYTGDSYGTSYSI